MLRAALLSVLIALLLGDPVFARTLRVPAEFSTIQAAVDAAQPGDRVIIGAGSYHESVLIATDRITLMGKPGHEIVGLPGGSGFAVGVSLSAGVILKGLNILGLPDVGILIDGCEDVVIKRCNLPPTIQHGIQVLASTGTRVLDNTLVGSSISLGVAGVPEQTSTHSTVAKNTVIGAGLVGIESNSGENMIASNRITDGGAVRGSTAIVVRGAGTTVKRNRIDRFGALAEISGSPMAIEGDDHFVVRNVVTECAATMFVGGTAHRIVGNVLLFSATGATAGPGISLAGVGSDLTRNTVRRARGNGITVFDSDHILKGNKIFDAVGDGICVVADRVLIKGNLVFDSGKDGIDIDGGSSAVVLKNIIKRSANDGIEAAEPAAGCLFRDNRITDVDEYGFNMKSGSHTLERNSAKRSGLLDLRSLVPPEDNTYIGNNFKTNNLLDF